MKKILTTIIFTVCAGVLFAQQTFVAKGKIEFEKKENLYKMLDAMWYEEDDNNDNEYKANIKKSLPQFKNTYYDLYFDESHSLYKAGRESDQKISIDWMKDNLVENIIYNDVASGLTTSQKTFFGTTLTFTDTARHMDWHITNEVRTIAGFECRKATAIMLDSIYVIAFYTDQILASSGPESFSGLPGMILGVAVPRINTTWFATKLELQPVTAAQLTIPAKGKKVTPRDFTKKLGDSMKDWGKSGRRLRLLVSI